MKRILISLLISMFAFSFICAEVAIKGSVKAVKMQKLDRSRLVENEPSIEARGLSYWNKPYNHSNRNGAISLFKKSIKKLDNYINSIELILNINDVIESAYKSYKYIQTIDDMNKFDWELAPKLELNDGIKKK